MRRQSTLLGEIQYGQPNNPLKERLSLLIIQTLLIMIAQSSVIEQKQNRLISIKKYLCRAPELYLIDLFYSILLILTSIDHPQNLVYFQLGSNRWCWRSASYAQLQSAWLVHVIDVEFVDALQRIFDRPNPCDSRTDLLEMEKVNLLIIRQQQVKRLMRSSDYNQQTALINFQKEQQQDNQMVLRLIKGTVALEALSSIGTQSSANEALVAVEEYFNLKAPSNASNIDAQIRNELCDDKYHSAMQFVVQMEEWFDDLTDCGYAVCLTCGPKIAFAQLVENFILAGLKKSILHTDNMALLEQQCNRPDASSPVSSDKPRQVVVAQSHHMQLKYQIT
ncbi:hypothetical protein MP228_007132 [Amoeboaphelidium protococcarum]|nr:hypothetical protein MP228_007132 [Amoeboaphelidium protococcarum]